ncbi:MAG: 4-(cytidine 5'-diphospho)-2-C-methyl-D-erythritol kinase [Phycisphaerae bacterium]
MTSTHFHGKEIPNESAKRQSVLCPAKLNLGLKVFPKRDDGYHDIDSWFVPLSLSDTLTIEDSAQPELKLTGLAAGISTRFEDNLAGRAANAMADIAGRKAYVRIHIDKLIPTGGGLGGGSSDAAGTILALKSLWQMDISTDKMAAAALKIGSDVPFFIHGVSARCMGRGERITPLCRMAPLFAVLIVPPRGTSTADVYREFDRMPTANDRPLDYDKIINVPARIIDEFIFNDLQAPAFAVAPWLKELHAAAAAAIGQTVHMSGSGSTLFTLHDRADEAESAVERFRASIGSAAELLPVRVRTS